MDVFKLDHRVAADARRELGLRQPRRYISTSLNQAMLLLHGVFRSVVPFDDRAGDSLQ